MHRFSCVALCATALSTAAGPVASAADLKLSAPKPAPVALYDWTGCYLGVHAGYGTMLDQIQGFVTGGGGVAGGQVGCNYQVGQVVLGMEAEGWWSGISTTISFAGPDVPGSGSATVRNVRDVDVALRAGVALDRMLIFGKVGAVWGRFDSSRSDSQGSFANAQGDLSGLLVGLGMEYAFADQWTAKLEYDYLDYLRRDLQFDASPGPLRASASAEKHVVKVGLNYRFGAPRTLPGPAVSSMWVKAPVVTGSIYNWTGCYVGAHAGYGTMRDTWASSHGGGGVAGGQLGCNYQTGSIVLGLEAEGWWSGISAESSLQRGGLSRSAADRNRWDADVAMRVGLAVDRALIFSKAGIAWGRFDLTETRSSIFGFLRDRPSSGTVSGVLMGGGLEYALAGHWTAKLEYDYVAFLNHDFSNQDERLTQSASKHVVKAGINYRLGGSAAPSGISLPQPLPPPAFNWTGCYVGAHAGGGVMSDSFSSHFGGSGVLTGGQAGCNLQTGRIVVGLEGEGWWSGLESVHRDAGPTFEVTLAGRNRWDADLAVRAGFAVDRALIYAKVGAAWGAFDLRGRFTDIGAEGELNGSTSLGGLLLGGGLEYAFAGNWTAKLEYNHIDYLVRTTHREAVRDGFAPMDSGFSAAKDIVKLGLNYQFRPQAVLAKY